MQFRERSRVIQVIRTVYDPAIKRGRAELVARLDKDNPEIDDDVRRSCSPAELTELEEFLAARNALLSELGAASDGLDQHVRVDAALDEIAAVLETHFAIDRLAALAGLELRP